MKRLEFPFRYMIRNAGRRKLRFFLGALGVFVGVTLLTAIQVGLDSLSLAYIDFATIAAGKADAMIMSRNANPVEPIFFDPAPLMGKIDAVEGVAGSSPGVIWGALASVKKRGWCAVETDPAREVPGASRASYRVVSAMAEDEAGTPWEGVLLEEECLLSPALARYLGAEPGDRVKIYNGLLAEEEGVRRETFKVRAVVSRRSDPSALPSMFAVLAVKATERLEPAKGTASNLVVNEREAQTALIGSSPSALSRLDLGEFLVVDGPEGVKEGSPWKEDLGVGECLLSATLSERLGAGPGDTIRLAGFRPPFGVGRRRSYSVRAVVEQRGVFTDFIRGFCVTGLGDASAMAGREGSATLVAVSFENRRRLYDARDVHQSVLRARAVGERVQEALGLEYNVLMPKSMVLDLRDSITSLLRGIFSLFGAVALAISALLIYSLLSISVEERVRENAILRTLGGKQRFIMGLVLGEGILLCVVGSVLGVFGGIALTWLGTLFGTAFARTEGFPLEVRLFIRWESILAVLGAGFLVSIVSSLLPALRSVRSTIVEALNAYRSLPSPVKIIKERSLDTRLVATGFVMTLFMGFFTIIIPRTFASGDPTLVAVVLGVVLIALLVGMVLFSLGAQPLLEKGVLAAIRPFLATASNLVERNLKRYRRRNTTTSLMFSLSVALVLFIASMAAILFEQAGLVARFMNGADLRIETFLKPRIDFEGEIAKNEGVEKVVRVAVGSMARSQEMVDWRIRVYVSDLVGIRRTRVTLYGAGVDLLDVLFREDLRFHEGSERAFRELAGDPGEEKPGAIILPRSVASALSVGVGSLVKIQTRAGPHRAYRTARVTAVMDKLPGFPQFFSGQARARGAGVLVSHEMFGGLLGDAAHKAPPREERGPPGIGEGFDTDGGEEDSRVQWRTIYLVKTKPGVTGVGKKLREKWGWGRMGTTIHDAEENVRNAEKLYYSTQVLFTAILVLSVAIALFGLLASMYTTVLERKREVVILKALGMRRADLFRMFAGETTALLLTSGILGALTGFMLAYMLISQQSAISELPTPFTVPLIPVIGMIFISVGMGLFGAWLPTHRLLRKSPAEIIREG